MTVTLNWRFWVGAGLVVAVLLWLFVREERRLGAAELQQHEADSVAAAVLKQLEAAHADSTRLADSLNHLQSKADTAAAHEAAARQVAKAFQVKLRADSTEADSLRDALATTAQQDIAIAQADQRHQQDSLLAIVLTVDRDRWKHMADSLGKALVGEVNAGDNTLKASRPKLLGFIPKPSCVVGTGMIATFSGQADIGVGFMCGIPI